MTPGASSSSRYNTYMNIHPDTSTQPHRSEGCTIGSVRGPIARPAAVWVKSGGNTIHTASSGVPFGLPTDSTNALRSNA